MAHMRQKSYHDKGTAPRHFDVGDYVYLKVSPTNVVQRFGVKGKLALCYFGPNEVIEVCGQWLIVSNCQNGFPQSTMCFM
jgi:hypothetical protein